MSGEPAAREPSGDVRHYNEKQCCSGMFSDLKITHIIEFGLTIALVAVAMRQVRLSRDANQIATEAVEAARESVELTEKSVALAKNTAKIELRAYVLPSKGEVVGLNNNGQLQVRITLRNSGQTPAYEVISEFQIWWQEVGGAMQAGAQPTKEGTTLTMSSDQELSYTRNVAEARRNDLRQRRQELHAFGTVRYRDIFGDAQELSFHFVQGGAFDPTSSVMGLIEAFPPAPVPEP